MTGGTYVNTPINYKPQYLQQFNLSIQRQMGSWLFASSYLGNKTTHLVTAYEANPAVYIAEAPRALQAHVDFLQVAVCRRRVSCVPVRATRQARRMLTQVNATQGPSYATIGTLDDGGIANYNGLLSSVQRRTRSMSLIANYTYAHCLSEAETTELTGLLMSFRVIGTRAIRTATRIGAMWLMCLWSTTCPA